MKRNHNLKRKQILHNVMHQIRNIKKIAKELQKIDERRLNLCECALLQAK